MDFGAFGSQVFSSVLSSAIVGIITLIGGIALDRYKKGATQPGAMALQAARRPGPSYTPPGNNPYSAPSAAPYSAPSVTPYAAPYAAPGAAPYAPPRGPLVAQPHRSTVRYGQVLIHVAVLQFLGNVMGLCVGLLVGLGARVADITGPSANALVILVNLLMGTLLLIVCFAIIGVRVDPAVRWRHLTLVAIGTAIATLIVNAMVNAALGNPPLSSAQFLVAIIVSFFQCFFAMAIGGGISMLFRRKAPASQPPYAPASLPYQQGPYPYNAPPSTPMYQPGSPYNPQAPTGQPGYGQPGYGQQQPSPPAGAPGQPIGYQAPSGYPAAPGQPYPLAPDPRQPQPPQPGGDYRS